MKKTLFTIFIFSNIFFTNACRNCTFENCGDPSPPAYYIDVLDNLGNNLFSASNPVYNRDSLKVFGIDEENNITEITFYFESFSSNENNTILIFNEPYRKFRLVYNDSESDIIMIEGFTKAKTNKCCDAPIGINYYVNDELFCSDCRNEIIQVVR